jgi:hypothetical protein
VREHLDELELRQRHLGPAQALREHHAEAARGLELVDEVARQPPQRHGFWGARCDLGRERPRVREDLLGDQGLGHGVSCGLRAAS